MGGSVTVKSLVGVGTDFIINMKVQGKRQNVELQVEKLEEVLLKSQID